VEARQAFEATYRVRFDEAGADGRLRDSGLLRYAQDVAWQHSEAAGFGRDWYAERDLHWLVRWTRLSVTGAISYGETLHARTEVIGWRRVWARRHTRVDRVPAGSGGPPGPLEVATAVTDWVLLTSAGRPARVPPEIVRHFSPGARFTPEHVTLAPPPAEAVRHESIVRASDVDPMGHLNNAAYLDLVGEVAGILGWTGGAGREARLEYLRPALAGQRIHAACWRTADDGLACRLADDRGEEHCRVLLAPGLPG
jgi:acyl-ACP thioesterase